MCSLLLSHGADPTIPNCHSKTALDLTTSDQNRERLDSKSIPYLYTTYKYTCTYMYKCIRACITYKYMYTLSLLFVTVEFKGYQLLNAAERGDVSRAKKLLTCTQSLTSFQHMLTMDSALVINNIFPSLLL